MKRGTRIFLIAAIAILAAAFITGVTRRSGLARLGGDNLGLLRVEGAIFDVDWHIEQVREFARDESIKGVVIRIDSPGGAIAPTQELYEEIQKLAAKKTVVSSLGTVAASGGYYLACATEWITCNPGTITGSVGVIMELTTVKDLFDKIGLKTKAIKSGEHKDMGSPFRDLTPTEEELLQEMIMDTHDQFVEAVLEGRPAVERERVLPYFDGRIFTGRQALELGLVDEMGNLNDAIAKAAELAKLPAVPEKLVEPKQKRAGLFELLFGTEAAERIGRLAGEAANLADASRSLQLWRAF